MKSVSTKLNDPVLTERRQFSLRLQKALISASYSSTSPTGLARAFNRQYSGGSVTVHAARKWLVGEAIPTQDKLRVLAELLAVPIEWLRFGELDSRGSTQQVTPRTLDSEDVQLLADLRSLNAEHRAVAREIVRMLLDLNRLERRPGKRGKPP